MKIKGVFAFLLLLVALPAQIQIQKFQDRVEARKAADVWANKYKLEVVYIAPNSCSMLGVIKPNSYVTVCPTMEYEVGQVIIFKSSRGENLYTAHKIVAVRDNEVYTKGTFNLIGDGWIPKRNIIGIIDTNFIW